MTPTPDPFAAWLARQRGRAWYDADCDCGRCARVRERWEREQGGAGWIDGGGI